MWNNVDPRIWWMFSKHVFLVVSDGKHVSGALVDVDENWYVSFDNMLQGRTIIQERDEWPATLYWTTFPKGGE